MSDDNESAFESGPDRKKSLRAVKSMPPWKRTLIGLSLVLALVGGGSQIASGIAGRSTMKEAESRTWSGAERGTSSQPPAGASGFVARDESAAARTIEEPEAVAPPPSQLQRMAPHLTKIGGSFLVALVLGMIFRAFVKTAAMVTAAAAGLFFALTYFNVVDLDASGMKTQYESVMGWASAQAGHLKDAVFAALPSSTSAAAGFFVGMKR